MLPMLAAWEKGGRFGAMVPISATRGTNVDELVARDLPHAARGRAALRARHAHRSHREVSCGRAGARAAVPEAEAGAALRDRRRDRELAGAGRQGRRGHRCVDPGRARQPARHRRRQGWDDDPRRRHRRAQGDRDAARPAGAPEAGGQGRPRLDDVAAASWRAWATRHEPRARSKAKSDRRERPHAAAVRAGRAPQRRQVVAVQPPGRRAARAGRGHARRDPRPALRHLRLGRRALPRRRHRRARPVGRGDPEGDARADPARRRRGRPDRVRRRRDRGHHRRRRGRRARAAPVGQAGARRRQQDRLRAARDRAGRDVRARVRAGVSDLGVARARHRRAARRRREGVRRAGATPGRAADEREEERRAGSGVASSSGGA